MANMLQGQNIEDETSHTCSVQQVRRYPRAGAVWVGGQHPRLGTSRLPTVETASEEPGTGLGVGGRQLLCPRRLRSECIKQDHERNMLCLPGTSCRCSERCVHDVYMQGVNSQLPPGQWLTPILLPGQRDPYRAAAPKGPRGEESWEQVHEDPSPKWEQRLIPGWGTFYQTPFTASLILSGLRPVELTNLL